MSHDTKVDWKNNDKVFVPIYLGIVGVAGLIIFLITYGGSG